MLDLLTSPLEMSDVKFHIGHLDVLENEVLLLTLGFVKGLLLISSKKMLEEDVRSVIKGLFQVF